MAGGIELMDAIRDRYGGKKRNAFSEIECGASYARSMASFALPAVFSGFSFDKRINQLGFDPIIKENPFCSFWSFGDCWGTVCLDENKAVLEICGGTLRLDSLNLNGDFVKRAAQVLADGKETAFGIKGNFIHFDKTAEISNRLEITAEK